MQLIPLKNQSRSSNREHLLGCSLRARHCRHFIIINHRRNSPKQPRESYAPHLTEKETET